MLFYCFHITAPAQPSATGLPCIRPCSFGWVNSISFDSVFFDLILCHLIQICFLLLHVLWVNSIFLLETFTPFNKKGGGKMYVLSNIIFIGHSIFCGLIQFSLIRFYLLLFFIWFYFHWPEALNHCRMQNA